MRRIWKNGLFLTESEAVQSVYDSSSLYSDGVFEMCRSFNKHIFKLDAHLNRLLDSIKFTEMPCAYNFHQLKMAHEDLIMANRHEFGPDDEYRTLINVSRGPLPIYKDILEVKPWVMMTVYPLRWVMRWQSSFYGTGRPTVITSRGCVPSRFQENKVKHHARISSRLAELEARRYDKEAWPLLVDDNGFITESTGANFFIAKRDRVLTPEPRNCLRGISRNYVLDLCRRHGIEYRERNIEIFDAVTADEAFFTATPWSIMPCTSINGQKIGNGRPGKITKFLTQRWIEEVQCDFISQSERWDAEDSQKRI